VDRRPVLSLIARRDRHLHVAAMAEGSYDAVAIEGDCDLSFVCRGSLCSSLGGVGFARMWSGGRANRGLCGRTGKYVFEVRVERGLNVSREDAGAASADSADVHLCRVGWSTTASPTTLWAKPRTGGGSGAQVYNRFAHTHVHTIICTLIASVYSLYYLQIEN